jgi:peptidoglycan/xylan/chitin deacetylase (PgdA/CDA1 family)
MLTPWATGISAGLGAATALGLAAGGCAYAAMWPGSQLFGRTLIAPRRPGELALTFDDGPNPAWTPRLLEILASHDVRATFFLVGSHAQAEPELVRRIVAAGHLIGNHSWSHPNLALTSARRVREELTRTSQTLEEIAGRLTRVIDRLERRGRAANIVLHDGSHRGLGANRWPSVAAAGQLIAHYKSMHRFVTLDAWN